MAKAAVEVAVAVAIANMPPSAPPSKAASHMRPVCHGTELLASECCCFCVYGSGIRAYFYSFCTRSQPQLSIELILPAPA